MNIQKRGLAFRIRIKNASKCNSQLKNPQKKESKLDRNSNVGSTPKRAIRHSWSANWHMKSANRHFSNADWPKSLAWLKDSWSEIKLTLFDFLEIRTRPNSYLIIQLIFLSIPTSINRGCLSKFNTLFDLILSGSSLLIFQIPLR